MKRKDYRGTLERESRRKVIGETIGRPARKKNLRQEGGVVSDVKCYGDVICNWTKSEMRLLNLTMIIIMFAALVSSLFH